MTFRLKERGRSLIPTELKVALDKVPVDESSPSGYLVVKHLGIDRISRMADESKLSIQEAIAVLSCYLEESNSPRQANAT